jgi:hypothetical protein
MGIDISRVTKEIANVTVLSEATILSLSLFHCDPRSLLNSSIKITIKIMRMTVIITLTITVK